MRRGARIAGKFTQSAQTTAGAHASRRSTAAIAVASFETTTGSGPRFAGAFAPAVSELLAAGS